MTERTSHPRKRTQKTQPKRGKPSEIPVPKRGEVFRDLRKVAKPEPPKK